MTPQSIAKKIMTSIFLSAAILSIANIDTLLSEQGHSEDFVKIKMAEAKSRLRQQLEVGEHKAKPSSQTRALSDSLAQDEFGQVLPFATLSTLDPLNKILQRGIARFERTVYRSPDFRGEGGYDLVEYEIQHNDGSHSSILAYLDRAALTATHDVSQPDNRVPVIMMMEGRGESSTYSLYKGGNLQEQNEMAAADVNGMVSDRISASVPFLSVSR